jgi:phosphate transport system permease protein
MTNANSPPLPIASEVGAAPLEVALISVHQTEAAKRRLTRRYQAERRLKAYGLTAIAVALLFLGWLLFTLLANSFSAWQQGELKLTITLDQAIIDPAGTGLRENLMAADYNTLLYGALYEELGGITGRAERKIARALLSQDAPLELRRTIMENPSWIGQEKTFWLPLADSIDQIIKGKIDRTRPEAERVVDDKSLALLDQLQAKGLVELTFNHRFFLQGDSREPEQAGILGAFVGSLLTLTICLGLAVPFGLAAALYLEEFAPHNRWTDLIEVNINNLAAVPSIIFGLLGLSLLLQTFGMPRSAPLAGGMVLALMSLPTIIIATRTALKAVPPSIRAAALGLGASPLQCIFHHVLPLALPGIMTGTILAMARALGETAPLLMIGMVAFIADIPGGFTEAATVLPVQIYLWSDSPERAFVERTSAAILLLLLLLVAMNALAVWLRHKFERRW